MATYYVICITKHPTRREQYWQVEWIGTSEHADDAWATRRWSVPEVAQAIRDGDRFYCAVHPSLSAVPVVIAERNGVPYIRTEEDGLYGNALLAKRECAHET